MLTNLVLLLCLSLQTKKTSNKAEKNNLDNNLSYENLLDIRKELVEFDNTITSEFISKEYQKYYITKFNKKRKKIFSCSSIKLNELISNKIDIIFTFIHIINILSSQNIILEVQSDTEDNNILGILSKMKENDELIRKTKNDLDLYEFYKAFDQFIEDQLISIEPFRIIFSKIQEKTRKIECKGKSSTSK
ncbi:hypothetical protein TUBRATIS_15960 [Tubulinosema ratisbonensis]|uniref:Uncharacterized protein n=1 Tax=Tubulinosema ratisbonensis TaxID=291195 RepID=A0A437ALT3_9MICR|nr:hypothetical protein TUBRATIS_15960 [Tubulinosema ratisbonensis]